MESADYSANVPSENGLDPFEWILDDKFAGLRLDQALAKLLPQYSRSRLQQWIKHERVLLNGDVANQKTKVFGGEEVYVLPELAPEQLAFKPENIPLNIVFEDDHLIVINKPAGLVVHPGHGNWSGTLLNGLLAHDKNLFTVPRAGIVHRLDKETSGLMVVAKSIIAQTELVRQLQARTVKRQYFALVKGVVPSSGTVDAPIGRNPKDRLKMAVHPRGGADAKPAITHYEPVNGWDRYTLVCCKLETGRTHQIRVHMQHLGFPLIGDPFYGPKVSEPAFHRQALHAWRLGLIHPISGEEMAWEVPIAEDMQALIESLGEPTYVK